MAVDRRLGVVYERQLWRNGNISAGTLSDCNRLLGAILYFLGISGSTWSQVCLDPS